MPCAFTYLTYAGMLVLFVSVCARRFQRERAAQAQRFGAQVFSSMKTPVPRNRRAWVCLPRVTTNVGKNLARQVFGEETTVEQIVLHLHLLLSFGTSSDRCAMQTQIEAQLLGDEIPEARGPRALLGHAKDAA